MKMRCRAWPLSSVMYLASASLLAAPSLAQERPPYTLDQVAGLVESGVLTDGRILVLVRQACLGFELDADAESELAKRGASAELMSGLRGVCTKLPHVLSGVRVVPGDLELTVGTTWVLRAQGLDRDSTEIPGVEFRWSSDDTTVVDVSPDGVVVAKAPGATRVAARAGEDMVGYAPVRVTRAEIANESDRSQGSRDRSADSGSAGPDSEPEIADVKNPVTVAVLGAIVPGGGEFHVGSRVKGGVALAGAATALIAGLIVSSEETVVFDEPVVRGPGPGCLSDCAYEVQLGEVRETNGLGVGAAVAGTFWALALVDAVLTARRSQLPAERGGLDVGPVSVEVLPADGVRVTSAGAVSAIFLRLR